jgi:hypothetical protein
LWIQTLKKSVFVERLSEWEHFQWCSFQMNWMRGWKRVRGIVGVFVVHPELWNDEENVFLSLFLFLSFSFFFFLSFSFSFFLSLFLSFYLSFFLSFSCSFSFSFFLFFSFFIYSFFFVMFIYWNLVNEGITFRTRLTILGLKLASSLQHLISTYISLYIALGESMPARLFLLFYFFFCN